MSRQTPFSEFTAAAIPPVIVLGKRPPVQPDWNPTMKLLMAQCWGQTPAHRPLVREVRTTLESINQDRYALISSYLHFLFFLHSCHPLVRKMAYLPSISIPPLLLLTPYSASNVYASSISEGGINTPASIHSSISSAYDEKELGSERSNYPPRGSIALVFTDVENSSAVCCYYPFPSQKNNIV
jgi:hypothetical protein